MISIYDYDSFRSYLQALFAAEKRGSTSATLGAFAQKLEMSISALNLLLSGKRNLTIASLNKTARVLRLSLSEHEYFEALVLEEQADDPDSKTYYRDRRLKIRRARKSKVVRTANKHLLANWSIPALLIHLIDFEKIKDLEEIDYAKLSQKFQLPIPEVRRLVKMFESEGFLKITPEQGLHIAFDRVVQKLPQKEYVRGVLNELERRLDQEFGSPEAFFRALVFTIDRAKIADFRRDQLELLERFIADGSTLPEDPVLYQGCIGFFGV